MKGPFDVVTGGAGFIGSHLARALLSQGRAVRIIDNLSTGRWENVAELVRDQPEHCQVCRSDIRDFGELEKLFRGAEIVYHQAAMTSVQKSVEDPRECNAHNVEGTLNVLTAARGAGVRKVVFASSTAVYGDSEELPKREDMPVDPISPYAVSKYVGELYCRIFSNIYGLPALALRYFNVFGPRQDPQSEYAAVIPRFIARMLAGEPPTVYGDGEQSRDFIFVEDVIRANLLVSQSSLQGTAVNVARGERLTLNRLISLLNEALGQDLKPVYQAPRLGDVRHSLADISRTRDLLGFQPQVSLEEGLTRTIQWFQEKTTKRS